MLVHSRSAYQIGQPKAKRSPAGGGLSKAETALLPAGGAPASTAASSCRISSASDCDCFGPPLLLRLPLAFAMLVAPLCRSQPLQRCMLQMNMIKCDASGTCFALSD